MLNISKARPIRNSDRPAIDQTEAQATTPVALWERPYSQGHIPLTTVTLLDFVMIVQVSRPNGNRSCFGIGLVVEGP